MDMFQWDERYSVGDLELDQEHKNLLLIINLMIEHHREPVGAGFLSGILADLSEYAAVHFEHEEQYMDGLGYPGLSEQQREHRDFRRRIVGYCAQLEADAKHPSLIPDELYEFLINWWQEHILQSDMKYRDFKAHPPSASGKTQEGA